MALQHLAQDAYIAKLKLRHEQERQMQLLKQGKKVDLDSNVSLPGGDKALQVRACACLSKPERMVLTTACSCRCSPALAALAVRASPPQMLTKVGRDSEEADAMHKQNVKKKTARQMQTSSEPARARESARGTANQTS